MKVQEATYSFEVQYLGIPIPLEIFDLDVEMHLYCLGEWVCKLPQPILEPESLKSLLRPGLAKILGGNLEDVVKACELVANYISHVPFSYFTWHELQTLLKLTGNDSQLRLWVLDTVRKEAESPYFEYVDNFRWCRVGNQQEELLYKRRLARGCCGFRDWEAIDPNGQIWKFGFNHGH